MSQKTDTVVACTIGTKRDRVEPAAGPAMSAMHPKATDTSLRTSCRDGPKGDIALPFGHGALPRSSVIA
jgi:hypothetical protein